MLRLEERRKSSDKLALYGDWSYDSRSDFADYYGNFCAVVFDIIIPTMQLFLSLLNKNIDRQRRRISFIKFFYSL